MKQLLLLIRCLLLLAGIAGMLVSAWAFLDPSAFPADPAFASFGVGKRMIDRLLH